MDFGISEKLEQIQQLFAGQNTSTIAVGIVVILFFVFLPAILAAFLNRKHFKKILLACIPAGLSFIAWFALIGWAVTGKIIDKKNAGNNE